MTALDTQGFKIAIDRVVKDFQKCADRWWAERDIDWLVFHYLREEKICPPTDNDYIRAEFPTIREHGKRLRRYYDVAILDPQSAGLTADRNEEWGTLLPKIDVLAAVEVKVWHSASQVANGAERADPDIEKLMDPVNKVGNAYFLNFIEIDGHSPSYRGFRAYLTKVKKKYPRINILCVPSLRATQDIAKDWV